MLVRRAQIGRLANLGKRLGYSCFGLAIVGFALGFVLDFGAVGGPITALLIVGSILLAPAIVAGYAVKAADRADRERSW